MASAIDLEQHKKILVPGLWLYLEHARTLRCDLNAKLTVSDWSESRVGGEIVRVIGQPIRSANLPPNQNTKNNTYDSSNLVSTR